MTLRLRLTRRQAVIAAGGSLAMLLARPGALTQAQEVATPAPVAVGTPTAGSGLIKPTGLGAVPSTGASRPGPVNQVRNRTISAVVSPVGLTIPSAGVDAGIEPLRVVDGAMQDPSGLGSGVVREPGIARRARERGDGRAYRLLERRAVGVLQRAACNRARKSWWPAMTACSTLHRGVDRAVHLGRHADGRDHRPHGDPEPDPDHLRRRFDYVNGEYLSRTVVRATRSGPGIPVT
ncbi:MAG: hypothetical protein R2853_05100 [Thermomicrobiales bacterium]